MAEARICVAEATLKTYNVVYLVSWNASFDTIAVVVYVSENKWQSLKKKQFSRVVVLMP
jgi:hypothetical protein